MFWSFVRDNTLTKLLFCLNQYGVHRMLTFKIVGVRFHKGQRVLPVKQIPPTAIAAT